MASFSKAIENQDLLEVLGEAYVDLHFVQSSPKVHRLSSE